MEQPLITVSFAWENKRLATKTISIYVPGMAIGNLTPVLPPHVQKVIGRSRYLLYKPNTYSDPVSIRAFIQLTQVF